MSANAMMEKIEDVTVLWRPMIFICLCVDKDTAPNRCCRERTMRGS